MIVRFWNNFQRALWVEYEDHYIKVVRSLQKTLITNIEVSHSENANLRGSVASKEHATNPRQKDLQPRTKILSHYQWASSATSTCRWPPARKQILYFQGIVVVDVSVTWQLPAKQGIALQSLVSSVSLYKWIPTCKAANMAKGFD